jgi:hypothetical protein
MATDEHPHYKVNIVIEGDEIRYADGTPLVLDSSVSQMLDNLNIIPQSSFEVDSLMSAGVTLGTLDAITTVQSVLNIGGIAALADPSELFSGIMMASETPINRAIEGMNTISQRFADVHDLTAINSGFGTLDAITTVQSVLGMGGIAALADPSELFSGIMMASETPINRAIEGMNIISQSLADAYCLTPISSGFEMYVAIVDAQSVLGIGDTNTFADSLRLWSNEITSYSDSISQFVYNAGNYGDYGFARDVMRPFHNEIWLPSKDDITTRSVTVPQSMYFEHKVGSKIIGFEELRGRGIFISYRWDDTKKEVDKLYKTLNEYYEKRGVKIFRDDDSVNLGDNFTHEINEALSNSLIVLVIIGKHWLTVVDKNNKPRIQNSKDYVGQEVRIALRSNIRTIPVIVNGASIPRKIDLPKPLKALAELRAFTISEKEKYFHDEVTEFIEKLDELLFIEVQKKIQ